MQRSKSKAKRDRRKSRIRTGFELHAAEPTVIAAGNAALRAESRYRMSSLSRGGLIQMTMRCNKDESDPKFVKKKSNTPVAVCGVSSLFTSTLVSIVRRSAAKLSNRCEIDE